MRVFFYLAFGLLLHLSAVCGANVPTVTITENGKSDWKIVLPDSATSVDETAAKELQTHVEQMTKVKLPVVREKSVASNDKSLILIGHTKRTRVLLEKTLPQKKFAFDEIYIKMTPDALLLTGHERRGSLYAVYTFLEDVAGCRWWTAEQSFIPNKPVLSIPSDLFISYAPQMISREAYHRIASPGVFSARNKGNGHIPKEYGGRINILQFVHSFYRWIPPEKYFLDHPDWFCEIDGKRVVGLPAWSHHGKEVDEFLAKLPESKKTKAGTQLCLTNDEMRKELTNNVLQSLRKNPQTKIVDISQNDWAGYCTCPKCKAIDEREESQSGTLVHFLNLVAADIEKEFPDVLVETLAYCHTRKPPKHIKPRHNVLIRLCSIECSFVRPLDHPQNAKFADDIDKWGKISKYLFIWDYVTNYNDYISPFPNYRTLAPNVRYFVKHGAIGLFAEGEGDDFPELRNWTLLHLMWNPKLDETKLFQDFCDGYYGKEVTPLLKQYRDLIADAGEKSGKALRCFCIPITIWLDIKTLTEATKIMATAAETARKTYGENSTQLRNITKTKLAIDNVWLRYYRFYRTAAIAQKVPFAGPNDPVAAWQEFTQACNEFKISNLDIRSPGLKNVFETQLNKLKAEFIPQNELPDFCKKLSPDHYYAIDDLLFTNIDNAAERVNDPAAADGKATKMSTKVDWNVNYHPQIAGSFRVYASLRCEATAPDVPALGFGVYDPETKKYPFAKILNARELQGKEYKWIDFGTIQFTEASYFYFAHRHRPEVPYIYVDRVILVREDAAK